MSIVIHYFHLRARGEAAKLMLEYSNVPYELNTVSFPEWGGGVKASGKVALFGQLPSITTPSGKLMSQSGAIVRYIARVCKLVPSDDDLVRVSLLFTDS